MSIPKITFLMTCQSSRHLLLPYSSETTSTFPDLSNRIENTQIPRYVQKN